MIRQTIYLIWNQRRKNLGLSFEIFFSFLVLFAVFSFGLNNLDKYLTPLGFSYEKIWNIESLDRGTDNDSLALEVDKIIYQNLKSFAEIDEISYCRYNVPYSGSTITDDIKLDGATFEAQIHLVEDNFLNTMGIELIEGHWFTEEDRAHPQIAVLITEDLAKLLFPDESAIGKKLMYSEEGNRIVGVTKNYHYKGRVGGVDHAVFIQKRSNQILPSLLLKVNDRADATFEERLQNMLQQIVPGSRVRIKYLEEMRDEHLLMSIIPTLLLGIIGSFLIFNVALGIFGVLGKNINRRKQEIGLRKALGSTKIEIMGQFILEIIVLTTMSLILGLFFAIQFPLLGFLEVKAGIYLLAIAFAIFSIYLLVFLCTLIPSARAAELHPAIALREE